jgi:hypothetical protein
VFVADDGLHWRAGWTAALPRVGIGSAGEATAWPLRFVIARARRAAPPR